MLSRSPECNALEPAGLAVSTATALGVNSGASDVIRWGQLMIMRKAAQYGLRLAIIATLTASAPSFAQTLGPKPDPNDPIWLQADPPTPEECTRFGLRYWAKKTFLDKKTACQCVKCGWKALPPKRLCWRVC